jgi:hypothetical protein
MAYFFTSPIDVDIKLEGEEQRKQVEIKGEKDKAISCPVYYDGDSVTGQVRDPMAACWLPRSSLSILLTVSKDYHTCSRWQEDRP